MKAKKTSRVETRPHPSSPNGDPPENQFNEAARVMREFCEGLGSVIWRFTQLEKAFQTRAATLSSIAGRLRKNMGRLDRLHQLMDAELRRRRRTARKPGDPKPPREGIRAE